MFLKLPWQYTILNLHRPRDSKWHYQNIQMNDYVESGNWTLSHNLILQNYGPKLLHILQVFHLLEFRKVYEMNMKK